MNGRMVKKLRKMSKKHDLTMIVDFMQFVNNLTFPERVNLAWRVLKGKV